MSYGTLTATSSAQVLIAANTNRHSLIIINDSDTLTAYIGQDSSVTSSNGTPIYPNTNYCEDNGGTKMYCGPIYVVTDGADTCNMRYWERSEFR